MAEETKFQGGGELPKEAEENPGKAKAPAVGFLPSVSLNIWPPSQRTREAVIQRIVDKFTSESILSKRYGCLSTSAAADAARRIEEDIFAAIAASAFAGGGNANPVEDWAKTMIYSKEISKRVLETFRALAPTATGSAPAASPSPSGAQAPTATGSAPAASPSPSGAQALAATGSAPAASTSPSGAQAPTATGSAPAASPSPSGVQAPRRRLLPRPPPVRKSRTLRLLD